MVDDPLPVVGGEGPTPAHSNYSNYSNYFNPEKDPASSANIAAILAGRSDLVTWDNPR